MTPKRWLYLVIIITLILVGRLIYQVYQGQEGLTAIRQRGELRVGLDASFPPFEMLDEAGQVIGFDADIAAAIAADLGVTVRFVNLGFDGLYDALQAKQVDVIISGLPVDPRLTQDVAYSVNYFNAGQVLVSSDPAVRSLDDLPGREVRVEWGSMGDMEARRLQQRIPDLRLSPQPDPQAALQGEVAIVDGVTALSQASHLIVATLTDDWYAAAVRIDNRALLGQVNQTLTRLIESGELAQLQRCWFEP